MLHHLWVCSPVWPRRLVLMVGVSCVSSRRAGTRRWPGLSRAASPWRRFGKSHRLAKRRWVYSYILQTLLMFMVYCKFWRLCFVFGEKKERTESSDTSSWDETTHGSASWDVHLPVTHSLSPVHPLFTLFTNDQTQSLKPAWFNFCIPEAPPAFTSVHVPGNR